MRRYVCPAHPEASIPDPERGDMLPAEGRAVSWSAHWATMLAREDVTVGDAQDEGADAAAPAPKPPAPAPVPSTAPEAAPGIAFMITKAQRSQLRARGLDDEAIAKLTPDGAQRLLAEPAPAA